MPTLGNVENMKQEAYKIVDKFFKSFVDNNQALLQQMAERKLYSFRHDKKQDTWYIDSNDFSTNLCGTYCIHEPWNIRHIALLPCSGGSILVFMTENFDKLYEYDLRK
jgi:hypothetical protein